MHIIEVYLTIGIIIGMFDISNKIDNKKTITLEDKIDSLICIFFWIALSWKKFCFASKDVKDEK